MKILLVGQSAREHALAWKLSQSPKIQKIYVAPGNAGTLMLDDVINIELSNKLDLLSFAKNNSIDITIVGNCAALADGIVNLFNQNGMSIFGPVQGAAQLESSKVFLKNLWKI